jgi:N-acetylglucosamine kinase-like BadF-type ATPase
MKIKLTSKNGETITTTCAGISLHGAEEVSIHNISKRGEAFFAHHDGRIAVQSKYGSQDVVELTDAPLP